MMQFFDWLGRVVFGDDIGWVQDTRPVRVTEKPKVKKAKRASPPRTYGLSDTKPTRLATMRVRSGYRQREIADKLGVSNAWVSRVEHGRDPVGSSKNGLDMMRSFADIYGVSVDFLFDRMTRYARPLDENQ